MINEETAFAYLVGSKTCRGGLHTVDIREPTRPTYAGCFDEDGCKDGSQRVCSRGTRCLDPIAAAGCRRWALGAHQTPGAATFLASAFSISLSLVV